MSKTGILGGDEIVRLVDTFHGKVRGEELLVFICDQIAGNPVWRPDLCGF